MTFWYWHNWSIVLFGSLIFPYRPINDALSTYWPINDALLTCLPIDSFIIFKVDQAILSEEDRVVCIRWDFLFNFFLFLPFSAYDPQEFGFLDLDPQKYADPRIRIQAKNWKKIMHAQSPNLKKREIIRIFLSMNCSSSFSLKISEKKMKNILTILLC